MDTCIAIRIAYKKNGKADSLKEGIVLAAEMIDSGKALGTLHKLIEVSNRPDSAEVTA